MFDDREVGFVKAVLDDPRLKYLIWSEQAAFIGYQIELFEFAVAYFIQKTQNLHLYTTIEYIPGHHVGGTRHGQLLRLLTADEHGQAGIDVTIDEGIQIFPAFHPTARALRDVELHLSVGKVFEHLACHVLPVRRTMADPLPSLHHPRVAVLGAVEWSLYSFFFYEFIQFLGAVHFGG